MKVRELYEQVSQLGFETSLDNDKRFYYAANRGLLQVQGIRPAISHFVIPHMPLANKVGRNTFEPIERSEILVFSAENAKAFYFEAMGKGTAEITHNGGIIKNITIDSMGRFTAYRGTIKDGVDFVSGRVELAFKGQFTYFVKNVALFDKVYSDSVDDIPVYAPFIAYDVAKMTDDFLSLETPPLDADDLTRLDGNYRVEGNSVLLLPYSRSGEVRVRYKHKPKALTTEVKPSANETEIDLDEELCSILPLLVASYVWAEDEPSLAQYYLTLYNSRAVELEYRTRNYDPVQYENIYEG